MKLVTVGVGENKVVIGDEQVMFRHEKAFFHEPGIAVLVSDNESDADIEKRSMRPRRFVLKGSAGF